MKYVALLRGINVGGNNLIKMADLKTAFEDAGYTEVKTYINSGNVIFSTEKMNNINFIQEIENMLSQQFNYKARVVIRSDEQIKLTIHNVPNEWNEDSTIRCYVGFLTENVTKEMIDEIPVREGVDSLKIQPGVLYMTTDMEQKTKSGFNKMMAKKVYKEMTIRNYTTTKKILAIMNED